MKTLSIPAIVMASCVMMLNAQSGSSTTSPHAPNQKQTKPDYVALSECIGAKVSVNAGAEALRDAAASKKTATRPTGEITDILITTASGQTVWVVAAFGGLLGIGEKTIAIPVSELKWNPETRCHDADVSHDHVATLDAFDAKKANAAGLDEAMTAYAANWRTIVTPTTAERSAEEASATKVAAKQKRADKPVVAVAGTNMVAIPALLMRASTIDDYPLYARGEDFGKVSKCVVDRATGTLTFVIVGHGGVLGVGTDEYLLPFTALRLAKKGEEKVFVVDMSASDMTSCVKYEKPAEGIVDVEAARRCSASVGAKAAIGGQDGK